jgi:hypothetical protein
MTTNLPRTHLLISSEVSSVLLVGYGISILRHDVALFFTRPRS